MEVKPTALLFEVIRSLLRWIAPFFHWWAGILESVYFFSDAHRLPLVDAGVWFVVLSAASFSFIRRYVSPSSPVVDNAVFEHRVEPSENAISHHAGMMLAPAAIPQRPAANTVIELPSPPVAVDELEAPHHSAAHGQI